MKNKIDVSNATLAENRRFVLFYASHCISYTPVVLSFKQRLKKLNRLNLALERLVHTIIKMNAAREIQWPFSNRY